MERIFSYAIPFRPFGLSFSPQRAHDSRLAITSFDKTDSNIIQAVKVAEGAPTNPVQLDITLPQTSIMFCPLEGPNEDTIVVAGDCLRVLAVSDTTMELISEITISDTNDPITCIDWIADDETQIIAGSTDATASAIDITTGVTTDQLLAHDHPINDIKYFGSSATFITAGFDGSLRAFDLRFQMSSSIYFQTAMPLLRASVFAPNKIALIAKGSQTATIIDIRMPLMPSGFGVQGNSQVTDVAWSHTNPDILYSSDADGLFAEANTATGEQRILYNAGAPIESFTINDDLVAIACNGKIEVMKLPQ